MGDPALLNHYIAGLFDGIGHIETVKIHIQGKYEVYTRIRLSVFISTSNIELINLLKEDYGGEYIDNKGGKPRYRWHVSGRENLLDFLNRIKLHVIIKREQVELAIQFCETLAKDNKPVPLSKVQHGLRKIVHARFQTIKE